MQGEVSLEKGTTVSGGEEREGVQKDRKKARMTGRGSMRCKDSETHRGKVMEG